MEIPFLDCPGCGEPVTTLPACNDSHRECGGMPPRTTRLIWCEDRDVDCPHCGVHLTVSVDDGVAELVAKENDEC
jgi:hypothetical protein